MNVGKIGRVRINTFMFVECMICLVRILDETVSDIYNVDVGLLATVNNAFAEEESTVIIFMTSPWSSRNMSSTRSTRRLPIDI